MPTSRACDEWSQFSEQYSKEDMLKMKPVWTKNHNKRIENSDAILVLNRDHKGIKGYGSKKSLKLIKQAGNVENALATVGSSDPPTIQEIKEIREIFLHPEVTDDYSINWSKTNKEAVLKILCDKHHFSQDRIDPILNKFSTIEDMMKQKNLFDFNWVALVKIKY